MSETWDRRFLELAEQVSGWSKDPSIGVGAVAVRDRRVLATGFNGFPAGLADDGRLEDRGEKLPRIVHAEQNVVAWAARTGARLEGASLYVHPYHPCAECAKLVVQAGISEVVIIDEPPPERWRESFDLAGSVLKECGVTVRRIPR